MLESPLGELSPCGYQGDTLLKTNNLLALAIATTACMSTANVQARTEIQNKGSDTLVNVAQTFAEEYAKVNHPAEGPHGRDTRQN